MRSMFSPAAALKVRISPASPRFTFKFETCVKEVAMFVPLTPIAENEVAGPLARFAA